MTEDSALVSVLVGGGLDVRFLSRRLNTQKPPSEDDSSSSTRTDATRKVTEPPPLPVPKKTKLYVEFAKRERDNAADIYNAFQQDLVKLRLKAAEAYVKVLTGSQNSQETEGSKNHHLALSAAVSGLGPHFKIAIKVMNTSQKTMTKLVLVLAVNSQLYSIKPCTQSTPALVPGLQYVLNVPVMCLAPETGCCGDVRISVIKVGDPRPLISATVTMPVSELDEE